MLFPDLSAHIHLSRQSWKVDTDGRIVRVIRLRPSHPLVSVTVKPTTKPSDRAAKPGAKKAATKLKRSRLLRIRPTVIDPSRYGARRLPIPDGSVARAVQHAQDPWKLDEWAQEGIALSKSRTTTEAGAINEVSETVNLPIQNVLTPESPSSLPIPAPALPNPEPFSLPSQKTVAIQPPPSDPRDTVSTELAEEAARSAALVRLLLKQGFTFDLDDVDGIDDKDRSFAVRGVSVSSSSEGKEMEPIEEKASPPSEDVSEEDEDIEMDQPDPLPAPATVETAHLPVEVPDDESDSASEASSMDEDESRIAKTTLEDQAPSTAKSLKAMFAPREEEGTSPYF